MIFIPTEEGNFLVIRVAFLVPESDPYVWYGKTRSLEASGREPRAQDPRKQPELCCLYARENRFLPMLARNLYGNSIPGPRTIFKAYLATSVTLMPGLISLFTLGTREIGSMPGQTLTEKLCKAVKLCDQHLAGSVFASRE